MGTYPVPTDPQLLLDTDSTIWYAADANRQNLTPILATEIQNTQDWKITTNGPSLSISQVSYRYWILVFPELRNISAYSMRWTQGAGTVSVNSIRTSTDTTNGQDGTWTQVEDSGMAASWLNANETSIRTPKVINWTSIRAIEIRLYNNATPNTYSVTLQNFNLFGTLTYSGLRFWDPTLDVPLDGTGFDFGDVFQSGVYTKQFRIKNTDAMTANNVTISSPSTPESGTLYEGLSFSTDGTTFTSSVVLTTIAPGVTTAVLYVRRTVGPSDPQNTLGTARIQAVPSSWT